MISFPLNEPPIIAHFSTQNLLFYYETETSSRPSGLIFLEGSYCERLIAPNCIGPPGISSPIHRPHKEEKLQVKVFPTGTQTVNGLMEFFNKTFSIAFRYRIDGKINDNTI